MTGLDWGVIGVYSLALLGTGVLFARRETKDTDDYFLERYGTLGQHAESLEFYNNGAVNYEESGFYSLIPPRPSTTPKKKHRYTHMSFMNDITVPFMRGQELQNAFPTAKFVHTKGLGHYKIITYHEVIKYIAENII